MLQCTEDRDVGTIVKILCTCIDATDFSGRYPVKQTVAVLFFQPVCRILKSIMNLVRRTHRNSLLFWLLALTVGLRTLIAPGYMLETNGDGPLGLGIVLCEGLNGTLPLKSVTDDPHAAHHGHDTGVPEDQAANGMTGTTCALWSTSSTFIETLVFTGDHLLPVGPERFVAVVPVLHNTLYRQQPQQPRAPPVFSLIV